MGRSKRRVINFMDWTLARSGDSLVRRFLVSDTDNREDLEVTCGWVYLESLALADIVRKYIVKNPYSHRATAESNPSWNYYRNGDYGPCIMQNNQSIFNRLSGALTELLWRQMTYVDVIV